MEGKTTKEHKKHEQVVVNAAIITLSDTRTFAEDESGRLIAHVLKEEGHTIVSHKVIKDEKKILEEEIRSLLQREEVKLIFTNGGTGIAPRDIAVETVKPFFEKEITAFASLFTMMSYEDIGTAALLSRSCAGISQGKVIFCMPGSPKAVELALEKIIMPELQHVLHHLGGWKK